MGLNFCILIIAYIKRRSFIFIINLYFNERFFKVLELIFNIIIVFSILLNIEEDSNEKSNYKKWNCLRSVK